jgi:ATP-dependent DNA helicase
MKRLNFLLEKSGAYATILGSKLAKQQEEAREKAAQIDNAASASGEPAVEEEPVAAKKVGRKRKTRSRGVAEKQTDANYQLTDYLKEDVSVIVTRK